MIKLLRGALSICFLDAASVLCLPAILWSAQAHDFWAAMLAPLW